MASIVKSRVDGALAKRTSPEAIVAPTLYYLYKDHHSCCCGCFVCGAPCVDLEIINSPDMCFKPTLYNNYNYVPIVGSYTETDCANDNGYVIEGSVLDGVWNLERVINCLFAKSCKAPISGVNDIIFAVGLGLVPSPDAPVYGSLPYAGPPNGSGWIYAGFSTPIGSTAPFGDRDPNAPDYPNEGCPSGILLYPLGGCLSGTCSYHWGSLGSGNFESCTSDEHILVNVPHYDPNHAFGDCTIEHLSQIKISINYNCDTDGKECPYGDSGSCSDCCTNTECVLATFNLNMHDGDGNIYNINFTSALNRLGDTLCWYSTRCFPSDTGYYEIEVFTSCISETEVTASISIVYYIDGIPLRRWYVIDQPVFECDSVSDPIDLLFWSDAGGFGSDDGGTVTLEFKDECIGDDNCNVTSTECSVPCIICDDCDPYCPDEGKTYASFDLEIAGGECGICTCNELTGDGAGRCADCAEDCVGCGNAGEGETEDCVHYNICDPEACELAGHSWYCDEDDEDPEAQFSPCSWVTHQGNIELPYVSGTSDTMTFSDTFSLGVYGNMVITLVFHCSTKEYYLSIVIDGKGSTSRCVMEGSNTNPLNTCDSSGSGFNIDMVDNVLMNTCTGNGASVGVITIHREGCE